MDLRARVGNGSLMTGTCVLAFAASVWMIGINGEAIFAAPARARPLGVAGSALLLVLPVLVGAVPAWLLSRAGIERGLSAAHGRMTRWFVAAWLFDLVALAIVWLVLLWHAVAGLQAPAVDLPVLVFGIWSTAFTAYVPALIAWQARRREAAVLPDDEGRGRATDDGSGG